MCHNVSAAKQPGRDGFSWNQDHRKTRSSRCAPQHICSTRCNEGGPKVAVRWIIEGHCIGYGLLHELGAPTAKRVQIMGMTHSHCKDGKIVDEWRLYDGLSLSMPVKLAQMADQLSVLP